MMEPNRQSRTGHEPISGLYYEVLGTDRQGSPPLVFIHGGGATGAAFRRTPDDRPGWADLLADAGYECWVTDWPGIGRSGGRNPLELVYEDIVDGYSRLLTDTIRRPCIVLCHSMGGPATWALVERVGELVAGVLSVAASAPANASPPPPTVLEDDGNKIKVVFGQTGVEFNVDWHAPYIYEDAYIYEQGLADSTRFPRDYIPALRASLVGIPPKVVLQKIGVLDGFPTIVHTDNFVGLPVRIIAGDRDPAHTFAIESGTRDLLTSWGADADLTWLPDVGIEGNGHFLYGESNSVEVLDVVRGKLDELTALARERRRTAAQA
jgi:pimeloyl-ACP methyl ester carboxylesterase